MNDPEFCPKCELWNKRNPTLPQRDPYYETTLCPNCWGKPTKTVDEVLEFLEKEAENLNHKRPTKQ